ncbi:MAG TPA: MotA/TolQ/ExbB proton channel family protein [Verrucomicrobiota bacterium]|nr:MotA/TolQ/ExbB proton channel family protein [Verrucomicrobiota bacterium]HNU50232.1 MotA/TolQ/ExbB proton channel family protein [Verrucomicrobiota bacterium]
MWQFLVAGGPFMFALVLTSVVSVAFIIERGLALRRGKVAPPGLEAALERFQPGEDLNNLKLLCQQQSSSLGRLVLTGIEHLHWPKADNADCLQTRARHEVVQLERGLVVLEVIVGIAPLLGLVGTLHGLITLFGDLGRTGLADNSVVARGIAIALNTTLMGLLIAIPTLIAWSYFTKKVESLAVEMETLLDEFLRRQYRPSVPSDHPGGSPAGPRT